MCYDERLLRSWATNKARKRDKDQPAGERDRSPVVPEPPTSIPETKRRKDMERELEEIV